MNIESTYFSIAEQQEWCDQLFNNQEPSQPNVTAVNKYGGWNMTPSNVFFSNGECEFLVISHIHVFANSLNLCSDDPWRTLSVNSQESNSPQRNGSETVPTCNTPLQFPSFFGTTYPQQVHAADIFMTSGSSQGKMDAYAKGVVLFSSALDQWLPCYTAASSANGSHSGGSGRGHERLSSGRSASISCIL